MNKAKARNIDNDIKKALAPILKNYNLILDKTDGQSDFNTLKLTFEFQEIQEGETAVDVKRKEFEVLAPVLGFDKDAYGKIFRSGATQYKIMGLKPSRPKYPIIVERVRDGKRFKFSTYTVAQALMKG